MLCPRSTQRIVFAFALATLQSQSLQLGAGPGAPPAARAVPTAKPQPTKEKEQDYSQEGFVIEKLQTMFRFEKDGTGRREVRLAGQGAERSRHARLWSTGIPYSSGNEKLEIENVACISQMARW